MMSGSESRIASSLATDTLMGDSSMLIKRDSDVWFEDGNIVVVAQSTAFRFHKSVVSLHSSLFRDLFSIPQPAGGELGGAPSGHLQRDQVPSERALFVFSWSLVELELLPPGPSSLGRSHDTRYLHPDRIVTFPVLAALARLSHKYQLDQLLSAVVHRLKHHFTTCLSAWDARGGADRRLLLRLSAPSAIEALNLFRLIDRPDMIPIALYECAQLNPVFLVHGGTRSDGITREQLSPADMELCMEIKEELLQATACLLTRLCEACDTRIETVTVNPGSGCASPADCVEGLRTVISRAHRDLSECLSADPLDMYYMSAAVSSPVTGEICRACGTVVKVHYSEERRRIWDSFPKLMGVEVAGWDSA
uniref:BTB domain-containing protein n=1 Tax=Ganoderma boninense TaxID=34458 RepID=A0A5K1K668_9APHY|nr:Uncharacterized protein [Ganoderma boninense]